MVEVVIGRQMASHKCTHQAATARPSPGNKHAYPLPTLYPLPPASPPQPIGLMHEASRTAVSHQASSVAKLRQSPSFVRSQASSVIKLREPSSFVSFVSPQPLCVFRQAVSVLTESLSSLGGSSLGGRLGGRCSGRCHCGCRSRCFSRRRRWCTRFNRLFPLGLRLQLSELCNRLIG